MPSLATAAELTELARGTGLRPNEALTLLFSAKESVFKCLYPTVQRFFGFFDARIEGATDAGARRGDFTATLQTTLAEGLPVGTRLHGRFVIDVHCMHTGVVWPRSA
jgi:enterobactin synthetase component D